MAGKYGYGMLAGHREWVESVAFSPDGQLLVSGSADGTIRFWDAKTQKQVALLSDHAAGVTAVAISRNGQWLVSGSWAGIVSLWKVNLPNPLPVLAQDKLPITLGAIKQTSLLQNYPNPFNPETWLPFVLHESADVEIEIYNATGNLVRSLPLGYKASGVYDSRTTAGYWDGANAAGEAVSSGVYFYQMRAGDRTFVRKALLVK